MTLPNRLRILVKSTKFQGKSPAQVMIHVQVALTQMGKLLLSVHKERGDSARIRPEEVISPIHVPVPAAHQQAGQTGTRPE